MARRILYVPQGAYAAAGAFLADTLDWLNLWHHYDAPGSDPASRAATFHRPSNHLSPRL
jgi:hypothetical protein